MKNINLKQPKYIFPAILYVLLLITGWLFIDMFTTEVKTVDPRLMATEYLNSELPEARIDERLGNKRENMVNAFGDVKDYTAVANAERDSAKGKEEYETRYNAKEAASVQHDNELEQLRQLQKRAQAAASSPKMGSNDFVVPLTEEERQNARRLRGREGRNEADDLLAQARSYGKGYSRNITDDDDKDGTAEAVAQNGKKTGKADTDDEDSEQAETVIKKTKGESEYFNTVSQNDPGFNMITAIIDENIKAVDGSRVRLRLLDDVEIGGSASSVSRERSAASLSVTRLRLSISPSTIQTVWRACMYHPVLSGKQPRKSEALPCSRACHLTAPALRQAWHSGPIRPSSRLTSVPLRPSVRPFVRIR